MWPTHLLPFFLMRESSGNREKTSLLLANCGLRQLKLLEQKGLVILGSGIASINIGLDGKR